MTDEQIIQVTRTIAAPIVLFLVALVFVRQFDRVIRHRRKHSESPDILIRDITFFAGLAFLLSASAVAGALGIQLGTIPAWVILSSAIGIGLLVIWAYYEYIVIGRQQQ